MIVSLVMYALYIIESGSDRRFASSGDSAIFRRIADESLAFISAAAARVNVTISISSTFALPSRMILRILSTRTAVLPDPAAAETRTDLSSVSIALSCSSLNLTAMMKQL